MPLTIEPAFTLTVDIGEARVLGRTHAGLRRVIPISGGTVIGPKLTGEILPGGADWNVVRPDGAVHVWARYEIQTNEGAIISVVNEGIAAFNEQSARSGAVMLTRPLFEVPENGPTWLATSFFIGELRPVSAAQVRIDVRQVLTS